MTLRLKTRALLGGIIGLGVALLAWSGALDSIEDLTVDARLRLRKPQAVSDEVRLVGLGDRDVGSELGRWPFPRAVHGDAGMEVKEGKERVDTFSFLHLYTSQWR